MAIHFERNNATDAFLHRTALEVPGWLAFLVAALAFGTAIYHIAGGLLGVPEAFRHRLTHLALFLLMSFLFYPLGRSNWREPLRVLSIIDGLLIAATVGCFAYMIHDVDGLAARSGFPTTADLVNGTILLILVFEAVRRTVGSALVVIPAFFMFQALFAPYFPGIFYAAPTTYGGLVSYLTMDTDGMLGVPISVAATFIIAFMMFGAVLVRSGAGQFFTDLAYAATGWMRGGPAKAAVMASCFYGTLSGSTTANVVTTGSFTIPLMKSSGFSSRVAAAIEAIASNGGQIMPPVMGAAAFIIPMYIPGTRYRDVALAAAIPAVLYYISLLAMVHLEACKHGLVGEPRNRLPDVGAVMRRGWPLLLSLAVVIILLLQGFTPMLVGISTLIVTVIVTQLRAETRLSPGDIMAALENGVRASIPITMACAAAGIIVGSMDLSGLAGRVSELILDVAAGNLAPALLMTMIISIILGMGMTTTVIYITLAALVVPSLISIGVTPMAANLFVFYFGALSGVTPPVALTTYAAAGVAGSNPWQTGWTAAKFGLASFIIPFMFVYTPPLLLDGSVLQIVGAAVTAMIGVAVLAAAVQGYLIGPLALWERACLGVAALLLISPSLVLGLIAVMVCGIVVVSQRRGRLQSRAEGSQ